jgi:hypothetical protein
MPIGPRRPVHIAHAAAAKFTEQLIDSNPAADPSLRSVGDGHSVQRRGRHKITACLIVSGQKGLDFTSQIGVIAAHAIKIGAAIGRIETDSLVKQVFHALPSLRIWICAHV